MEEMKADLVALFLAPELRKRGYYDDRGVRTLYASGVLRMLQKNRPRPDQNYGVMQLMQMNWFLERGALAFNPQGTLMIRWDQYPAAVASLLQEVLAVQYSGDHDAASKFIERWTHWDARHEKLAHMLKATETSRFSLIRFAALGE
jgi:hypothetical protein